MVEIVAQHLKRHDLNAPEIEVHGERYRRKGTFEKEYHGLAGAFTVERSLYCPASGRGRSVVPMELRSGVIEGAWTPLLARVMVRAVASTTPKEASEFAWVGIDEALKRVRHTGRRRLLRVAARAADCAPPSDDA